MAIGRRISFNQCQTTANSTAPLKGLDSNFKQLRQTEFVDHIFGVRSQDVELHIVPVLLFLIAQLQVFQTREEAIAAVACRGIVLESACGGATVVVAGLARGSAVVVAVVLLLAHRRSGCLTPLLRWHRRVERIAREGRSGGGGNGVHQLTHCSSR